MLYRGVWILNESWERERERERVRTKVGVFETGSEVTWKGDNAKAYLNLRTVSPHRWKSIEWLSNNSIQPQQVINDIIG